MGSSPVSKGMRHHKKCLTGSGIKEVELIGQDPTHRHFQLVNRKYPRNLLLKQGKAYSTNESINKPKLMQVKFKKEVSSTRSRQAELGSAGHFVLALKL